MAVWWKAECPGRCAKCRREGAVNLPATTPIATRTPSSPPQARTATIENAKKKTAAARDAHNQAQRRRPHPEPEPLGQRTRTITANRRPPTSPPKRTDRNTQCRVGKQPTKQIRGGRH
uniref:Uncharacterized protein n=1 Tax=Arundo donax TaxID=35708 RepID=A0A0A9C061_ARUDO